MEVKKKTTVELLNDFQRFERILQENLTKGYVSIQEKTLSGVEDLTFEI